MKKSQSKTVSKTGSRSTGHGKQTTKATPTISQTGSDVEVSPVAKPDKSWSFYVNDERVTYEQWVIFREDHKKWCEEQEKAAAIVDDEQ